MGDGPHKGETMMWIGEPVGPSVDWPPSLGTPYTSIYILVLFRNTCTAGWVGFSTVNTCTAHLSFSLSLSDLLKFYYRESSLVHIYRIIRVSSVLFGNSRFFDHPNFGPTQYVEPTSSQHRAHHGNSKADPGHD